jgi:nucleotide-binding universal stress UspA family protein
MSIKRILAPLPTGADHACEIEMALSAAKALNACVEGLYIRPPEPPPRIPARSSYYGYSEAAVASNLQHNAAEERARMTQTAHDRFIEACAIHACPVFAPNEFSGAAPAATWQEADGDYVEVAVRRAAAFDLVVAASAAVVNSMKDIAERSLLQTRRPVLLAPTSLQAKLTDTLMIAWDESPECWHAVSAAIPFMKVANAVQIISVDRHAQNRTASQAELSTYLRCHGIHATAEVVAPDLRSVGDTLLAAAAEQNVGLLVMGAYSHSRLREMLLGGATRHVLKHAAARPVLLMH